MASYFWAGWQVRRSPSRYKVGLEVRLGEPMLGIRIRFHANVIAMCCRPWSLSRAWHWGHFGMKPGCCSAAAMTGLFRCTAWLSRYSWIG